MAPFPRSRRITDFHEIFESRPTANTPTMLKSPNCPSDATLKAATHYLCKWLSGTQPPAATPP